MIRSIASLRHFASPNAAILLCGCGSKDGSEIHETTSLLISLSKHSIKYKCYASNAMQYHTIDHSTEKPTNDKRNMLSESARLSRGNIQDISTLKVNEFNMLAVPGGFGMAKNLSDYGIVGKKFTVKSDFTKIIMEFY